MNHSCAIHMPLYLLQLIFPNLIPMNTDNVHDSFYETKLTLQFYSRNACIFDNIFDFFFFALRQT